MIVLYHTDHFYIVVAEEGKMLKRKSDGSVSWLKVCSNDPSIELEVVEKDGQLYFDF